MSRLGFVSALLCGAMACGSALASEPPPPTPAAASPAVAPPAAQSALQASAVTAPVCCVVPAGTLIVVELADAVDSKTAHSGDKFKLRLAQPVLVGGTTVLPAGTSGVGEVIDAKPGGYAGRPGRLIVAARYLEVEGGRVPLQSFKLGGAGSDNTGAAFGVTLAVGIVGMAVQGGNVSYAVGTKATAKVAADTTITPPTTTAGPSSTPNP